LEIIVGLPNLAYPAKRLCRQDIARLLIITGVVALAVLLIRALRSTLADQGINFSFDYLFEVAGIPISEGHTLTIAHGLLLLRTYVSTDMNSQALLTGLFNTITVSLIAIVAATVLGVAAGLGRFSSNWLLRKMCFIFVEAFRNTPLLVQLMFWYFGVLLQFPPITAAKHVLGAVIISVNGISAPSVHPLLPTTAGAVLCLVAVVLWLSVPALHQLSYRSRKLLMWLVAVLILFALAPAVPLELDYPAFGRFQGFGGARISPEMAGILLAISVNSAAYIAEIVRGAIDSLPIGQWEAGLSLGLSRSDVLRRVVVPQAGKIVLPSLGNQYISLTKNTSLGIAIGFPELFNVTGTIANQTGRSLEGFLILMVAYMLLSTAISLAVNSANSKAVRAG
jgi:His/Glu/Gln/Arg/opine family amino acid ABC transporter permease subunit